MVVNATAAAERPPMVIGVTGNIACGKSSVVRMLRDLGALTIDADEVYHELIRPGEPLWQTLRERFGPTIIAADNTIDRRALGGIVFSDPAALADLDKLTHPAVVAAIRNQMARISEGTVVIDAVKLVESGLDADCDQLWVVVCEPEQQIDRLVARNGISRAQAEQRLRSQPPLKQKLSLADVVIDNSGTLDATRRQVDTAWHTVLRLDRITPA
jgi:dephospho-CoA kinase